MGKFLSGIGIVSILEELKRLELWCLFLMQSLARSHHCLMQYTIKEHDVLQQHWRASVLMYRRWGLPRKLVQHRLNRVARAMAACQQLPLEVLAVDMQYSNFQKMERVHKSRLGSEMWLSCRAKSYSIYRIGISPPQALRPVVFDWVAQQALRMGRWVRR